MPLRKAQLWTDIYYRVVEEFFWRPQIIGRKSDPNRPSRPWSHWRQKLASQEVALNHILDLLFHIAPQELLDLVVSDLLTTQLTGFELVEPSEGLIDPNIVQPDVILSNGETVVFLEMKVDSKSGIDQFVKYAIASHLIRRDEPALSRSELVILGRELDHAKVWKRSKSLGLKSAAHVRAAAKRGLGGDDSVWSERGVQRFLARNPTAASDLGGIVESMGLVLADYHTLADVLRGFAAREETAERLVHGVLGELNRRGLA